MTDIKQKEAETRSQFLRQAVIGKVAVSGILEGLDTKGAWKRGKLQGRQKAHRVQDAHNI